MLKHMRSYRIQSGEKRLNEILNYMWSGLLHILFYCVSAGSVVFVQSVESKSYCISLPQAVFRERLLDLSSLIGHFVTDIMSAHGLQPVVLRSCLYSLGQWKQLGFCFIRVCYNDCARCWLFVWIWDSSSRELCSIRAGSLKARSQLGR